MIELFKLVKTKVDDRCVYDGKEVIISAGTLAYTIDKEGDWWTVEFIDHKKRISLHKWI